MNKKVLKLFAELESADAEVAAQPCVKLTFQNYKDGYSDDGSEIFIYRREEPGYIFDYDEREYFECIAPPTAADVIFRGHLPDLHTFCEYRDTTVERGRVYAYWVGKGELCESLTGPVAVKVRDGDVWWRFERILRESESLVRDFPKLELVELGETPFARPLKAIIGGRRDRMIACVGAVHAGESGPEILLTALRDILTENRHALDGCGIAIMPVVSADNREQMACGTPWYIRKNSRGVDLNRNFDADWERVDFSYGLASDDPKSPTYRGPHPDSEPEVRAVIKLMEAVKPKAVFSYHFLCSICTDRLVSYGGAAENKAYIAELDRVSREYSRAFRDAVGVGERSFDTTELICSAGSLIAWLYKRGVIAYDLEMSEDLSELFPSKKDKSTPEMLSLATRGHKAALLKMLELFGR